MLSSEPKMYVPGGRLQKVGAGQGEGKGTSLLLCFLRSSSSELFVL